MKAVLFDLDGTLAHSAPDLHAAGNALLDERGLPPIDLPALIGFVGEGVPKLVARILAHHGADADPSAIDRFRDLYDAEGHARTALYPGVAEALMVLRGRGLRLGVCTNKPERPARELLGLLGAADWFDAVVGGDTLPVRKPDAAPLRLAAERCDADTDSCLYVGDSETDALTAKNAGAPFLLFTNGYRKAPVAEIPHRAAFQAFADLPALVNDIAQGAGR